MKKRIFIGIFISQELRTKILQLENNYRDLPVRWVKEENLHLTLIPPMQLDDNEVVKAVEKLQTFKNKVGPVEIRFNRISLGPNPRRPRLIWLGGEPNQKLIELKNKLTQILGLRAESRSFRPHLTITRFKPKDYANFPIKDLCEEIDWKETAESFSIIQSECLESGARYTVLEKIRL